MFLPGSNTLQERHDIKGLGRIWRVRKHTSWALEKHKSSHIHHPTRTPLTSSFFTQRRTESLSPNMESEFLHSFPSILLITSSLGGCYLFWQIVLQSKLRPLVVTRKHNLICDWKDETRWVCFQQLHEGKKRFSTALLFGLQLVFPCYASSISKGVLMTVNVILSDSKI